MIGDGELYEFDHKGIMKRLVLALSYYFRPGYSWRRVRWNAGLGRLKRKMCRHEFDLADLKQTGIDEPARPEKNDYAGWMEWYAGYYESDHVRKRVVWPCCKCGEVFYAHCGLDIYEHGTPKRIVPNVALRGAHGRTEEP